MVKKILAKSYLYIILALLYIPILLIIVYSFSNSSNYSFANGFSFGAYTSIFTSVHTPQLVEALKNTLIIAAVSSVIATLFGTIASIGIFSLKRKVRAVVENVNQMPIINSEVVMAVSFMIFFATLHFPQGMFRLIVAHITFCIPYVILSVMPRLNQLDPNIYESALDLGANPFQALVKVLIPMLVPGIISGFVMSFTLSMDDFIITQINKGNGIETLSTYIYEDTRLKGLEPFWYAIFSIIFVLVLGILLGVNFYNSRKKPEKQEGETRK